jgi:glyoxylase-like metal-dependent hydrolase (beta-lactamase superfamily II)
MRLAAIVLTHQHPDHVGAALACAERYQLPIWTHPLTAERLAGRIPIQRFIHDGDRLDLGQRPDRTGTWYLEALHTPGHAVGHLCFYEPYYRLLFAGDMVSPLSSIVIVPPDGDLAVYLQSLYRLQTLDIRLLLPAHGNASSLPQKLLVESIEHRRKREQMLLAALSARPLTLEQLVPDLYKGTPAALLPLAEKQLLAGLQKLQREGKVVQVGNGWRLMET